MSAEGKQLIKGEKPMPNFDHLLCEQLAQARKEVANDLAMRVVKKPHYHLNIDASIAAIAKFEVKIQL